MSTPRQDDTERDAWLSEALRHAPDAQAAPPSALSDAILRQARAAANVARAPANTRPKPPARSPWAAAWDWFARPPVAAGFASVMVATLLGLMWWDQPMDPTIARPPALDATPPAAAPPPVTAAPQPNAPASEEVAQGVAKAEPAASKPAQRRIEAEPARRMAPAREREGPEPFADRGTAADATAAAPATPPPAAAPAAAPAPAQALRARAAAAPTAAESKAEMARDESRAPTPQRTDNVADARPAALGALLASIGAQPERWTWERRAAPQPIGPALQRWLARLDAATASARWRPAAETAASGETAVLRLYRDGVLAATLRLDDESVELAPGPRAALPPATLATLKQALDDATR
ncbi:MAG: hypothetical protein V4569_13175 [Pseudomonadota bacterium]